MQFIDLKQEYLNIKQEINEAIQRVLDSGNYIGGLEVENFEREIAEYHGVKYAISVNSGTDALFLSLKALGIGVGDEVITTPFTFVATAGAIVNNGAKPVFVDINPDDFNIDSDLIEEKITPKTKAILPVHLFGMTAEMDKIMDLSKRYSLFVIEDVAQATGAEFKGKKVGSIGISGCLSFYPTKNLAGMGDGGTILTNEKELNEKARVLKNHGMNGNYVSETIGFNSRLDAIQAAILRVKLKHLGVYIKTRKENAIYYCDKLNQRYFENSTYNQYTIRVKDNRFSELGFPFKIYYPSPLHLQPAFRYLGYKPGDFPESEKASREVISLPLLIGRKEQDEIIKKIKPWLQNT